MVLSYTGFLYILSRSCGGLDDRVTISFFQGVKNKHFDVMCTGKLHKSNEALTLHLQVLGSTGQ
jgi:hypothetical protein